MTRNIRWWNRLGAKLTALIGLVTLATIGVFAFVAIESQRTHIIDEVVRGGYLLSQTIKASIYHHMLADQRDDAYTIMEAIGQQKGIDSVRMFNASGRITFSTQKSEVGQLADRRGRTCTACHPDGAVHPNEPCAANSSRIYNAADGHRVLGMVTPVYNEKSCWTASCHAHPESQRVLGVVDMGMSLEEVDRGVTSLTRSTLLLSGVLILVLAALVTLFARAFIVRPVVDLVRGTHWVAERDLEHEIPVHSSDELGVLANSFNRMTRSLRETRSERDGLLQSLEKQVEDRTAALKHAQDQLIQSEKMSSLGKLSASIAHEINNPLMGILTIAKLLIRTIEEDKTVGAARDAALRQLRMVQRETERCSAIVRNLLDFSRQRPLTLKDVDIRLPLDEALSVAANQMSIQGIKLEKQLAPGSVVRADMGQLRQAFLNVILNACDAMPRGGTLTVSSRRAEGNAVEIDIGDTGAGISPENLQKIFDPFFTTKEKGTGLGLSVVYGIVQRHGGKLDVRSEVGKGTTFTVRLPATANVEAAA